MKALRFTLILIMLGTPLLAGATNWVPIGSTNTNPSPRWANLPDDAIVSDNGVSLLIDKDSIRNSGKNVKAWVMWQYSNPQEVPFLNPTKHYLSQKVLEVFDCVNVKFGSSQIIDYADLNGGDVVDIVSTDEHLIKLTEPPPESMGESLLNYVCNEAKKKKK